MAKRKFAEEDVPYVLGWIAIPAKEAKLYLDNYGGDDIRRAASCLGWAKATGQTIAKNQVYDFEFGEYTYRMNVQTSNTDLLVPEDELVYADIHVMCYWNDFHMLYMGWQWSKILKRNEPRKNWLTDNQICYIQSKGNLRDLEDLLNQIIPERMGGVQVIQEAML